MFFPFFKRKENHENEGVALKETLKNTGLKKRKIKILTLLKQLTNLGSKILFLCEINSLVL